MIVDNFNQSKEIQDLLALDNKILTLQEEIKYVKKELNQENDKHAIFLEKIIELKVNLEIRNDDFNDSFSNIQNLKKVYQASLNTETYEIMLKNSENSINLIIDKIEDIEIKLLNLELTRIKHAEKIKKIVNKLKALKKEKKLLEQERMKYYFNIQNQRENSAKLGYSSMNKNENIIDAELIETPFFLPDKREER